MKKYEVLKPIARGARIERGTIIELDEKEAKNIGIGEYLREVESGAEQKPETPQEGIGEYDEAEETEESGNEESEQKPETKKKDKKKDKKKK